MVRFVRGNLFESQAQALVNTVNCKGAMGKGLAAQFKSRFGGLFEAYTNAILAGEVAIGKPTIWKGPEKWVINFPTKDDWRKASEYSYIEAGLARLRSLLSEWNVGSIAMPALGCGLGSLDWKRVKPMIELYLGDLQVDIEVYEPE